MVRITIAILFALSLCGSVSAANFTPPTWPLTFTLRAQETERFAVPVTAPTRGHLTVTWTKGQLSGTLRSPNNVVTTVSLQESPAQLPINVTANDVAQGLIWVVNLKLADTPPLPVGTVVTVQVTYTGAIPDMNLLRGAYGNMDGGRGKLNERHALTIKLIRQTQAARFKTMKTARLTRVTALRTKLRTLFTTQPFPPPGTGATSSIIKPKPLVTIPTVPGHFVPADPSTVTPTIISVTDAQGIPGDTVTIKAVNLVPANNWSADAVKRNCVAWFTVSSTETIYSKVTVGVSKDTDGSTLMKVRVPSASANVVQDNPNGSVFIVSDAMGTTNAVRFNYKVLPVPEISDISATQGAPGDTLTLTGNHFETGDVIYFTNDNGQGATAKITRQNVTSLTVTVPTLPNMTSGTIYHIGITYQYHNQTFYSNKVDFTLLHPVITSLDNTSACPGDSLLITGANYTTDAVVHLHLDAGGNDYLITPDLANPQQLMLTIPDNILVPVGGLPGSLFVQCGNNAKSDTVRYTLNPIMDTVDLPLDKLIVTQFTKKDGADTYTIYPASDDPLLGYFPADLEASHFCGGWGGHHGDPDDIVELPVTLKNGYTYDHAECLPQAWCNPDQGNANVVVEKSWYQNGIIHLQIHWYVVPDWPDGGEIDYILALYVKGPIQYPAQ